MMQLKVMLLNNGGFSFLSGIEFPIEVIAEGGSNRDLYVKVKSENLSLIGARGLVNELPEWTFIYGEFEVVDE